MLQTIINLLFPERCVLCHNLVESWRSCPFCRECLVKWESEKSECRHDAMGQATRDYLADGEHYFVLYMVRYDPLHHNSPVNQLIYKLKNNATNILTDFVAAEYERMLRESAPMLFDGRIDSSQIVVTWIPRRPETVLADGFDHMERCASALSKRTGFKCEKLLNRQHGSSEQKRLNARRREINALESLSTRRGLALGGRYVVLIDDIITTGASMKAATKLLTAAGASMVIAAAIAATSIDNGN